MNDLSRHYNFIVQPGRFGFTGNNLKTRRPDRLRDAWYWMHKRCRNPLGHPKYHLYGGKGIIVCDRWNDFENFKADMGPAWAPGLTLDRKDSNGNYEPQNCRWATQKEQQRNKRTNILIDTPLGRICLTEAVEVSGLSSGVLRTRMKQGVSAEHMFDPRPRPSPRPTPHPKERIHIFTPKGFMPLAKAAKISGINARTLQTRLRYGVPTKRLFDPPDPKAGKFKPGNRYGSHPPTLETRAKLRAASLAHYERLCTLQREAAA